MGKKFNIVLVVILIAVIFIGCKRISSVVDTPKMQLDYTTDGNTVKELVNYGAASWNNGINSFQSDSLHPLDSVGIILQIKKTESLKELKISFSSMPTSYTVRRWEDSYIKNSDAYEKYYEIVGITDNAITLPVDNKGYIYEVHAIWSQGNAYYAFYITNSNQ